METLRVDVAGVQALADRTQGMAGELVAGAAPAELAVSGWSSPAAVDMVHVAVMATGDALASRIQITAAKISAANIRFVARETGLSDELAAVARTW